MADDDDKLWLSEALKALPEQSADQVNAFAKLRPALKGGDAEAIRNQLIGLTAALGSTVNASLPHNARINGMVKSLVDELIRDRENIFLPPDIPEPPTAPPLPDSLPSEDPSPPQAPMIFLPPDDPDPDPPKGGGKL